MSFPRPYQSPTPRRSRPRSASRRPATYRHNAPEFMRDRGLRSRCAARLSMEQGRTELRVGRPQIASVITPVGGGHMA
ncbi:hypothetical protein CC85DRAFT_95544 [Cutaneotrichosporon oleaginosum]|uniref:Uncharacterized protein n=1 Tax=Cutaneotrichosporon oleaginosum TaxID=879819 RepID=A0A0J1B3Q8_9TREE|nr:uncharacterized protein CC85DRAFT_95544 [Cutaneotrichosporon oleaginosum]KLT42289.1 hypothetical protein CC85DRAFT_95544 [Cutaneotrichosporon oleaginosum]TXT11461.1 hypothetical protein COLE_01871 [Cutaneotrichosporon oleaginosum]